MEENRSRAECRFCRRKIVALIKATGPDLGLLISQFLNTWILVMLGVDRLDMIKGIPQKILAFEKFLEENPIWRDKVGSPRKNPRKRTE